MSINKKNSNTDGVSPVVGVMLMLVVTIIIAAVVSACSGGLTNTQKTPQATISAKFSQSQGMTIFHQGGDVLATADTKIFLSPTRTFGAYEHLVFEANKSVLGNYEQTKFWINATSGSAEIRQISPGDSITVSSANMPYLQYRPNSDKTNYTVSSYGFGHANAIGRTLNIQMVDTRSGKAIAQVEVPIES
jgi:FlaG/FlaF family flagellin (archaellin)